MSFAVTQGNDDAGVKYNVSAPQATALLFIDAGVQDSQALLQGVADGVKVVTLRRDADGVQQIASALKGYRNLDSIQIISHGASGRLMLGFAVLTDANLDRYQSALQSWSGALKNHGDILL